MLSVSLAVIYAAWGIFFGITDLAFFGGNKKNVRFCNFLFIFLGKVLKGSRYEEICPICPSLDHDGLDRVR